MILVRRVLPWIFAAALLLVLFTRYPLGQVVADARLADFPKLVSFLLVYFVYFSLIDSWGLKNVLSLSNINGSFGKIMRLRLASNLVMILNYGAGQGALAALIKQHYGVPLARSSGVLLLVLLVDFYIMLSISFTGTFLTPVIIDGLNLAPLIRGIWSAASLFLLATILITQWSLNWSWLKLSIVTDLLHAFRSTGPGGYLHVILRRIPLHFAASTYFYFLAQCFGFHIPLALVITLLPLTIVLGAIPITPSGLGTVQVSTIYLFKGFLIGQSFAPGSDKAAEHIFAMSIVFALGIYFLKLVSGSFCFRYAISAFEKSEDSILKG